MDAIDFLKKSPLFAKLSQEVLWRLVSIGQIKNFKPNEFLMKEKEAATCCYVITSGEVEVFSINSNNKKFLLAVLGAGEIIGELGIIDNQPRTASAMAIHPTQTLLFEAWDFKAQMQAYPDIALQLLPVIVKRLRSVEDQLAVLRHHE